MALPQITLTGNLTNDPELRFTNAGKAVATLRVACTERRKNDQGEWVDGDSVFLNVACWRYAEQITDTLTKGTHVQVTGTLRQRSYEAKDGTERTVVEVTAETVARVIDQRADKQARPAVDSWPATSDEAPF